MNKNLCRATQFHFFTAFHPLLKQFKILKSMLAGFHSKA